ncbi:MAG: hypothetical protein EBV01_15130 [Betaproteobacteria bacterium]|nr:hypothetical protein [Betaproteobacteria bacterium]
MNMLFTTRHPTITAKLRITLKRVKTAHHAYLSYGHQIQAVHYAEMAAKEDESVDHADVDHGDEEHVKDLHE